MKDQRHTRRSDRGSFIVDRMGTILGFDEAMESLTGWPATDVVGRHKDLGCDGDDGASLLAPPLYEGRIPALSGSRAMELSVNCRDGRRLEAETVVRRLDGPGERMHIAVLEVVSSSARSAIARHDGKRDPLTALADRDAFASRLEMQMLTASNRSRPLALVLVDVDHLREINDRHGHRAGDEVLQKIAGILRVAIDDERLVARVGEDDFAVILPGAGRGDARQVSASIRSAVERYRFVEGMHAGDVTVSVGAASYPADADDEQDLVGRAREALDEARGMGRNRVWCYLRRPRVPLEVPVYFDGSDELFVGYTRDLSPSGIFLQTAAEIDVGMRCALTFPLPGKDGRVHVVGRVVRTVPPSFADGDRSLRVPGLGVEFERFGGHADRHAIDSFLHDHEHESLRPETAALSV